MKHLMLVLAVLLCSNAQAATYIYQANAYQSHGGACGRKLLPFQVMITVSKAFPPSANLNVPLKSVAMTAGGKWQWGRLFDKQHSDSAIFETDSNANIIAWNVTAAKSHRKYVVTQNEAGAIEDLVEFVCGGAEVKGDPGTWTRTE